MKKLFAAAVLGLSVFSLSFQTYAQELKALPLAEYGKLPEIEEAAISPSGNRIAIITTVQGKRSLLALEDQSKAIANVSVGDMKIRYLEWIGDDRLMIVSSQTEDLGYGFTTDKAEFYIARVIAMSPNAESGLVFANQKKLVDAIRGNYGKRFIDGKWYGFFGAIELKRDDGKYKFSHARPFLYRVDMQDFSVERIDYSANYDYSKDWLVGADGEIAATFEINDTSGRWKLKNGQGKGVLEGRNDLGRVGLVGLGKDGTTVIMTDFGEEETDWFEVSLVDGSKTEFLPNTGFERLYFDDLTGHLTGYRERGEDGKPVFFDKSKEDAAVNIRKAFGDLNVRMIDWTSNLQQVVARTSGNRDSGTYFAVDVTKGKAAALAYERTAIEPQYVGKISEFSYKASDGTELDGILTLPPGKESKNLPFVMLPHGGPHNHDSLDFDWWAQAFASRGYAVFQPNFRGSTNRSEAFKRAGYGEWGRKMQADKTDGLKALAEAGIIDADRACIVGASYGGYAALAGVTVEQSVYRCAVAVAPVSDIRDMYQWNYRASGQERTTRLSLRESLGEPGLWDDVSPLKLASKADAPIMLIHGKDDVVVPYSHSEKMADKLKDHGKPYELVTLDGEDHWLSLSKTRQEMLEASVRFVEKHNPPT